MATLKLPGWALSTYQCGTKATLLPHSVFYITTMGANLMGLDLFHSLHFRPSGSCGMDILQATTAWHHTFPALFTGLWCITDFVHLPTVNSAVTPVIQPLQRVPLSLGPSHSQTTVPTQFWHHQIHQRIPLDFETGWCTEKIWGAVTVCEPPDNQQGQHSG